MINRTKNVVSLASEKKTLFFRDIMLFFLDMLVEEARLRIDMDDMVPELLILRFFRKLTAPLPPYGLLLFAKRAFRLKFFFCSRRRRTHFWMMSTADTRSMWPRHWR